MGCSNSTQASETMAVAAIPVSDAPPVTFECSEVQMIMDTKIGAGFFNRDLEANVRKEGALYEHVCQQSDRGMELLLAMTKPEAPKMPKMGEAMAMGFGGSANLEQKITLQTFFRAVPEGKALDTILTYEQLSTAAQASLFGAKVDMQSGIGATLQARAGEGYILKGATPCGMGGHMSGGVGGADVSSNVSMELLFQKTVPQEEGIEAVMFTHTIAATLGMMGMTTEVPDIIGHLKEVGAQGWELTNLVMMPPDMGGTAGAMGGSAMAAGGMMTAGLGTTMNIPVTAFMQRRPGAKPIKYTSFTYMYKLKMGLGSMSIVGDATPIIKQHAAMGWLLKGSLNLPMKRKGMSGTVHELPLMLFFMSNDENRV